MSRSGSDSGSRDRSFRQESMGGGMNLVVIDFWPVLGRDPYTTPSPFRDLGVKNLIRIRGFNGICKGIGRLSRWLH